jgi:hypothetical protein
MISDVVMEEALRLYQKDWLKTKHNSFMPDMYLFKNVMNIKIVFPYIAKANESLKIKARTEKLRKIRSKIDG